MTAAAARAEREKNKATAPVKTVKKRKIIPDIAKQMGDKVHKIDMQVYERWWRVLLRLKERNKKTTRPIVLFYYRCVCFFYPDRPSPAHVACTCGFSRVTLV